ncbi:MAG TPA: FAD-dependent oxidoreductase, partial [Patescibacteria group bacterium]|nr:FAD-dependent oxidoreductase [Patescibacteria group bacterium]
DQMMEQIVIIGGVAAGLKSAAKIRRGAPDAQITVVEKGDLISYGACGLPYYVSGDVDSLQQLMSSSSGALRNPDFFKNVKNINVLTKTEAIRINRTTKTVTVRNRETAAESALPYDQLVIATGASPIRPPIPGIDLKNIHQLWHPDDAQAVRQGLEQGRFSRAVILGAGLVGMEMAEALSRWKSDVTVVEMKDQLFPAFMDEEIAAAVAKYAAGQGIKLLTGETVTEFRGDADGAVREVVTSRQVLPTDLVILAAGARPNVELARTAGLVIGSSGAIAVDDHLRTSDPSIYAGGDCVENTHRVSGAKVFAPMGSTANKHGRIIGENICGGDTTFHGVLGTVVVKILDLNAGKTGLTERDAKAAGFQCLSVMIGGHDRPHYMPNAKPLTIKLIVDAGNRRLLGMQAFGEGDVAKRVDLIASVLTFGGTIDDLFDIDLGYAPPYSSPIDLAAVAANAAMNKLAGHLKGLSPQEVRKKLASCPGTVFLDVRSSDEYKQVCLDRCENLCHIPLGQLRSRLSEMNKDDEIIAFCKISLRGYEAALILEGEGFTNVKVMEGGLNAWPYETCHGQAPPATAEKK